MNQKNTNSHINPKGLGVVALAAIVISSMIGGGIYNLPQNMANVAAAGPIIIAWIVTGIGIQRRLRSLCRIYYRMGILALPNIRKCWLCCYNHGCFKLFLPSLFPRRK